MASKMLEYWRKNLKTCSDSGDIFEVIDRAIIIAILDHPEEFRNHRDEIMEKLYYKTEALLDDDEHREKEKVFNGVDHNKVYEDKSTIYHVDGVQGSISDHGVVSNRRKSSNNKILPVIRMKRVKKINSQDGWVATFVPRKMEEGSEQVTKCYNNGSGTGGDCQKTSNGSIHQILSQENRNSTKQVQATQVSCSDEEVMMIQQKIETSKRKLKEGYQAAAKKQHLVKVLDPKDLPKSCAALNVSQRYRKGPAVGRCY